MTAHGTRSWRVRGWTVTFVAAVLLGGCGGGGGADPDAAQIFDAPPLQRTTLSYDDGVVDEPFSLFDAEPGAQVAVRFTPPGHPTYVEAVELFVAAGFGVPTTTFRVRVYSESSETGFPDASLLSEEVDVAAEAGDTWVSVDLTEYAAVVEQGEFFVAMEWLTAPGSQGQDAQFIGADLSGPNQRSYYTEADPVDWGRIVRYTEGHDVDFMIRAAIAYPISP